MAEILTTITTIVGLVDAAAKIKQYVFNPIKAHFTYLFHYSNIIQGLRDQNQKLKSATDHLQQQIQAAKDNLHIILPPVEDWCSRVVELKEEIDRILGDEPRVQNGTCLQGTCPNLMLRHSQSREAKKLAADVDELLKEYNDFGSHISDPAPLPGMETIPATSHTPEFDSRKKKEEEIISCLRDRSICMIGVWGVGGVGKTTMAKIIGKRAIEEKLFDKTVMAVVSQQVDPLKIQQQLAEGLGLHLTQETVSIRVRKLHTRLKDEKVLIILDDVWKWLDLEELGIPSQIKILLTTRDYHVCKMMFKKEAARILKLEVLGDDEALSLLRENAGSIVDEPNFHPLAVGLAKECKGLPLALVTVGRSLRDEIDESIWKESLRQLQKSAPTNIPGYLEDVYKPLKLSYDKLESDEARYLFLLCCLFPEDSKIEIENLVRYGVGLRIFSAIESIGDARNRINYLVKMLIDRCLLMDAGIESRPTQVKMHDVIRDMAIFVSSSGEHVFKVSHDKDLKEWPCENYTCISLTLGEAMIFPEDIHCPGLKALLLTFDSWTTPLELLLNFLNGKKGLTLLSICRPGFLQIFSRRVYRHWLPLSNLSSLTKLRVLHLHQCALEDISLIGQLKDLEILSCRGSYIKVLPDEIGALKKLKLLDMTECSELKNIAPGVFSALKQLEELQLMGCPISWECEEKGDERRNACLTQVFSLENLTLLEIWIQDLEAIFQTMGDKQNLKKYSILIGGDWHKAIEMGRSRTYYLKCMSVCLDHVDQRSVFPAAISKLFDGVEQLQLKGNGCEGIIKLVGRKGFKNTKSLEIDGLNNLEKIYDGPPPVELFSVLEYLTLRELNELVYLWKCPNPKFSMSKLKKIKIEKCAKLKWLFPLPLPVESFSQLKSIKVSDCLSIEEVFKSERVSESDITTVNLINFPILKKMTLHNLPRLGALCNAVDTVIKWPSIPSISEVSSNFKIFCKRIDQGWEFLTQPVDSARNHYFVTNYLIYLD